MEEFILRAAKDLAPDPAALCTAGLKLKMTTADKQIEFLARAIVNRLEDRGLVEFGDAEIVIAVVARTLEENFAADAAAHVVLRQELLVLAVGEDKDAAAVVAEVDLVVAPVGRAPGRCFHIMVPVFLACFGVQAMNISCQLAGIDETVVDRTGGKLTAKHVVQGVKAEDV